MKAVRLVAPRHLVMQEEPAPCYTENEVLLQIQAVGICGSDMHRFRGDILDAAEGHAPLILGHECAATVAAAGTQVKNVRQGDRVAMEAGIPCGQCEWCRRGDTNLCPYIKFCGVVPHDGALREFMAWPAHLLYKLPENLTLDHGVLMEILAIGLHSIDLAHIHPGQTAAVLGSGPIGLVLTQLLRKTQNVTLLLTTDRLDYRNDFAIRLGAEIALNPDKTDVMRECMDISGGRGFDVVFEAAGVPQTCGQSVEICSRGGKVVFIGIPTDDHTPFSTSSARRKGLSFLFVRRSRMLYHRCAELLLKGTVDLTGLVTHHFPLSQTSQAFDLVDHYNDNVLKAIVQPDR